MDETNPNRAILREVAELAKAMSHPFRLKLLQVMAQGERSVERLAEISELTIANASQHLQLLRRNGLAKTRREGKNIYYSLSSPSVLACMNSLTAVAVENSAQVRLILSDYYEDLDSLEPISREELMERIEHGTVTVLDVRPEDEYSLGHVPRALCVSSADAIERLKALPKDHKVVAYCRSAYCITSFEVVAKLRELGYDVCRLEEGFPEWKAAGLLYETGTSAN